MNREAVRNTTKEESVKRPAKQDIIAAAADVWDVECDRAEAELVRDGWWIDERIKGWLRLHGFSA